MKVKRTLRPGESGTRALLKEYGDQLVCVRYRYDKNRQKCRKTVELVIDEKDWIPGVVIPADRRVHIRIGYGERELRERVKQAGGYWDNERKAWHLRYREVCELGLERRMLDDVPDF